MAPGRGHLAGEGTGMRDTGRARGDTGRARRGTPAMIAAVLTVLGLGASACTNNVAGNALAPSPTTVSTAAISAGVPRARPAARRARSRPRGARPAARRAR